MLTTEGGGWARSQSIRRVGEKVWSSINHLIVNTPCMVVFVQKNSIGTLPIRIQYRRCIQKKIKLKKVNKKRVVTVRRVIIFLNISRRPLLICLHCCLHHYKTLKAVATAIAAIVLLTPAKNLNKVFWRFLVVSPLFNHYQGYV